jgi:glycerol-3-phosphate acyltransferase PlsY
MNAVFAMLVLLAYRSLKRINTEVNYMAAYLGFLPPGVDTLRQALLITLMILILMVGALSVIFDSHPAISDYYSKQEQKMKAETKPCEP